MAKKRKALGATNKQRNDAIRLVANDARLEQREIPPDLYNEYVRYPRQRQITKKFDRGGPLKTYPNAGAFNRECPVRRGNGIDCTLTNVLEVADGGVLATVRVDDFDGGGRKSGTWLLHWASPEVFRHHVGSRVDPGGPNTPKLKAFLHAKTQSALSPRDIEENRPPRDENTESPYYARQRKLREKNEAKRNR